jgi:alpha-L-fucosidase
MEIPVIDQTKEIQDNSQDMTWYQQARFGLFIHWGAYSVAGVEASWSIMAPDLSEVMFGAKTRITEDEYVILPNRFNPVGFDADEWVTKAQKAGMRYIIITSKHHDGFCMFDAPGTDYKITKTPFGRDVCLELAQACEKASMPLGFYYSPPDMHHPGYRDTSLPVTRNWLGQPKRKEWGEYLDYMESHLRKLLTDYGKVSILWFDGLVNHAKYNPARFHKLIHELSPGTLINDRLGENYNFITPEQFIPRKGVPVKTGKPPSGNDTSGESLFRTVTLLLKVPGFQRLLRGILKKYGSGELELTQVLQEPYPSLDRFQPWETCMTMGRTWAYNPDEAAWKTSQTLVQNLIRVASRGGNYLLNVGPTAQGTFPLEADERLQQIGRWMEIHGKTIHGSTYTPLQNLPWGEATRKGNRIYLHIFKWPLSNQLIVESFPGTARAVRIFSGGAVDFTQREACLEIALPPQPANQDVTVLEVDIDGSEAGWNDFSIPESGASIRRKYLRSQAITNAWINSLINGLIAFFSYRSRVALPFAEIAIDIPITVFIIAFLVSWIAVGVARSEVAKGNLAKTIRKHHGVKLPHAAAVRALLITITCVIGFGGVFMDGIIYLASPAGIAGWVYIIVKTLYTGACAALAAVLGILSVFGEEERR